MPDQLKEYEERKERLSQVVRGVGERFVEFGHDSVANTLYAASIDILSRRFNVVVVGEFSNGKSTLLNALMGEQLLPAKMAPCTKSILEIHYGEERTLEVQRAGSGTPEIHPIEHLKKLAVLQTDDLEGVRAELGASDVERMIVRVPNSPCDAGVDLLDTPGLNEASSRTQITSSRLPKSDASVIVLRATGLLSRSEREFLKEESEKDPVDRRWLENAFVVVTFADVAAQDDEGELDTLRDRLDQFLDSLLAPQGVAPNRRYFVDARSALARRLGKPAATDGLEFNKFEYSLKRYLVEHSGRLAFKGMLLSVTAELEKSVASLRAELRAQGEEVDKLRERSSKARRAVQDERERLDKLIEAMKSRSSKLGRSLRNDFLAAASTWLDHELPAYMDGLEYDDNVIFRKAVVAEWYKEHALSWLDAKVQHWSNTVPAAELEIFVEEYERTYREELQTLRQNLARAADNLGLDGLSVDSEDESVLGWLMKGAAGWAAGGPLGAAVGGLLGWRGVLQNLAVNAGIFFALAIAGIALPVFGVVVVSAVVAVVQIVVGQSRIKAGIRDAIVKQLQDNGMATLREASKKVDEGAHDMVGMLADQLQQSGESILKLLEDTAQRAEEASHKSMEQRYERRQYLELAIAEVKEAKVEVEKMGV